MKNLLLIWAVMACVMPVQGSAASGAVYLPPDPDDFRAILGDPPAKDSDETRREIEIVLREQSRRTPADVDRIQAEAKRMVVAFAEVLGPKLTARDLPLTFALIKNVGSDTGERIEESKLVWKRQRADLRGRAGGAVSGEALGVACQGLADRLGPRHVGCPLSE